MKSVLSLTAIGILLATVSLGASASQELATKKNCMACHAVDKKIVGPSFKDIAGKYKGNKAAVALLATKIQKGGAGAWGAVPMPPNAVTVDEAKQLAAWVLATK